MAFANEGRYVVQKAPHIDGMPIPADEPVVVIRAQDVLCPLMLVRYLELYTEFENADDAVIQELRDHLASVVVWQADHAEKVKVADR